MAWLQSNDLARMGFAALGDDVLVSDKASIYNAAAIRIGNRVRIDDFCVISAGRDGIEIGDFVHIAVYCSLIGRSRITLSDFVSVSSRVSIFSSNDDYSGLALTNPTVPDEFRKVTHAPVLLERHSIVGSGSVILPGTVLGEGAIVGALSLVASSCRSFGVYFGSPARLINTRKRDLLDVERRLRDSIA